MFKALYWFLRNRRHGERRDARSGVYDPGLARRVSPDRRKYGRLPRMGRRLFQLLPAQRQGTIAVEKSSGVEQR